MLGESRRAARGVPRAASNSCRTIPAAAARFRDNPHGPRLPPCVRRGGGRRLAPPVAAAGRPLAQAQTLRGRALRALARGRRASSARLLPPRARARHVRGRGVARRSSPSASRTCGCAGCRPCRGSRRSLSSSVRTYVTLDDRPGIWLCSLEAATRSSSRRPSAASPARLPARIGGRGRRPVQFDAERDGLAGFSARYAPCRGAVRAPAPGTLEDFLCERYAPLHRRRRPALPRRAPPRALALQPAAATIEAATFCAGRASGRAARARFAPAQDLLVWRAGGAVTPAARASALISVVAAGALVALKLTVGLEAHSLGLVSEAVHSGTDLVAALLTFFAVGVAGRPADLSPPVRPREGRAPRGARRGGVPLPREPADRRCARSSGCSGRLASGRARDLVRVRRRSAS